MTLNADRDPQEVEYLKSLALVITEPERVLICSREECQYALQVGSTHVSRHLRVKHGVSKENRRGLDARVISLQLQDPRQLPPRDDGCEPHPHLAKLSGLACRLCQYRTVSWKLMDGHHRENHPASRRDAERGSQDLTEVVCLQTWVQEGARKYWIVHTDSFVPPPIPPRRLPLKTKGPASSERLDALHEAERARIRVGQTCNTRKGPTESSSDIALTTPWMQRTQWKETYRGARRDILARMTLLPSYDSRREGQRLGDHQGVDLCTRDIDEQRLRPILLAVDLLFDRCEETYHHTARPILCWLYAQHPTVGIRRPFRLAGRAATRNRYRGLWKRFVTFLLRASLFDQNIRRSVLKLNLITPQIQLLQRLWEQAGSNTADNRNIDDHERVNPEGEEEADDGEDGDEEYEQDDDSGDEEEDHEEEDHGEEDNEEEDCGEEEEEDEEYHSDVAEVEDDKELHSQKREGWTEDCAVEADRVRILADLILQLSVSYIAENFPDGQPSSSLLVFFSGILSFSDNGTTYRHARDYTPFLSGLIHQQRLLFLE